MKVLRVPAVVLSVLACVSAGPTVKAKETKDKPPANITVSFGTGNNNATAGRLPNHHVLPQEFRVRITRARKLDGTVKIVPATVNFSVAGLHWIWVYKEGVSLEEVMANIPATGMMVNYETSPSNVLVKGIDPLAATTLPLSSAQNRIETIAFSTPGTYLIICNLRVHLNDGMYAWVKVVDDEEVE
jgi:plastocyanin